MRTDSIKKTYYQKLTNVATSRVKLLDIMIFYCAIVFVLPSGAFAITSLYDYQTPPGISYLWYTGYASVIFFPIIIYGLRCLLKRQNPLKFFLFFMILVLVKDCIQASIGWNSFLFKNNSWELYFHYFVSICFAAVVFEKFIRSGKEVALFTGIFVLISIGVVLSVITGNGFSGRFAGGNMSAGETGFIFAMIIAFFLPRKHCDSKYLIIMISLAMLMLTGSRTDLLLLAAIFGIFAIVSLISNKGAVFFRMQHKRAFYLLICLGIIVFLLLLAVLVGIDSFRAASDRMFGMFTDIASGGFSSLVNDESGAGRIESILTGINVIINTFPFGTNFSFYDMQLHMQLLGYPTFPHSIAVCNGAMMGLLIVIPLYVLVRALLMLIKKRSELWLVALYLVVYSMIWGGAWGSFKPSAFVFIAAALLILASRTSLSSSRSSRSREFRTIAS